MHSLYLALLVVGKQRKAVPCGKGVLVPALQSAKSLSFCKFVALFFLQMDREQISFWGNSSEQILVEHFPMHRACRDGNACSLSSLLEAGVFSPYEEDQFYGWTPAHWAAYFGKLECLRQLIVSGVNKDVTTQRFCQTPAHIAAFGGHPHCLLWLLQAGANINAQDYLGEAPIHKAARTGSTECTGLLLAHGAKSSMCNNNGLSPADLARNQGFQECAQVLQQAQLRTQQNGFQHVHTNGHQHNRLSRKRGLDAEGDSEASKRTRNDDPEEMEEDCIMESADSGPVTSSGMPPAHDAVSHKEKSSHRQYHYNSVFIF